MQRVPYSRQAPLRQTNSEWYQSTGLPRLLSALFEQEEGTDSGISNISDGSSIGSVQVGSLNGNIQHNVNRAQRGKFEGRRVIKAVSGRKSMPPPANVPSAVRIPFPEHLRSCIGGCIGYSEAHDLYKQCQQFFHQCSMSAGNTELVTLATNMSYPQGGKFKAVGDLTAVIPHVNVRVGSHDLHYILYTYLLPMWLKFSRNVHLLLSDTILCNDLHAEILPRIPDVDAIKEKCYEIKGVKKTKSLIRGKGIKLFLHIDSKLVAEAEFRRIQYTEEEAPDISVMMTHITLSEGTSAGTSKRKRAHHHKPSLGKSSLTSSFGPSASDDDGSKSKKAKLRLPESLEVQPAQNSLDYPSHGRLPTYVSGPVLVPEPLSPSAIRKALSQQSITRTKLEEFTCTLYRLPQLTWRELVANPLISQDLRGNFRGEEATVTYSSKQKIFEGSFKMALTKCVTSEIVLGNSVNICLKRCFDRSSTTGERTMLCEDKQHEELSRELNCLLWAKVMLELVTSFIESVDRCLGTRPSFSIPRLQFVDAALVVARKGQQMEFYMMEELIPEHDGWSFHKYICNNSAVPLFAHETSPYALEKNCQARFLSFAQHVQYVETGRLAFTSDFQGAGDLLTDPQIITNPILGDELFARGNVAFDTLLVSHICKGNEFCEYYQPSREGFAS
ncbi:hypothetical protein GG344DRAFT_63197 [Lentinula edodes]|nr:hypothetical protein GG344DRAFT_63197 [Lentinula edodes]